ncbi:hypothetical protein JCM33374_g2545 [Metschnikowia sp. JCM 33374]|nr:hypothetical protein JCM33374_g2545 [Metschnikowia sp. JCM 33374]
MSSLLNTLNTELDLLDFAGTANLNKLVHESGQILSELRGLEAELEDEIAMQNAQPSKNSPQPPAHDERKNAASGESHQSQDCSGFAASVDTSVNAWYKTSIDSLKAYNGQVTKFSRVVGTTGAFRTDVDDAYTFPLMLNSVPTKEAALSSGRCCSSLGDVSVVGSCNEIPPWLSPNVEGSSRLNSRYTPWTDPELYTFANANTSATNDTDEKSDVVDMADPELMRVAKSENRRHLLRSIFLHLLKTGHGSLVETMLGDFGVAGGIDPATLVRFVELSSIVADIRKKHDITRALAWLVSQNSTGAAGHEKASFKFHMLQFVLLLSGGDGGNTNMDFDSALSAYTYAKTHFPGFINDHVPEISPIISLLLFQSSGDENNARNFAALKRNMHQAFLQSCDMKKSHSPETSFIAEILANFDRIHEMDSFFDRLANEFVGEYCKGSGLSTESSLFQSILAGHINLPNFYKYSQLQKKLQRKPVAEQSMECTQDLPFSLSSKNQFLFNFHPIFICPISKEQLVPIISSAWVPDVQVRAKKRKQTFVSPNQVSVNPSNPVVVFEHCRHLALKDSVKSLTKGGVDYFKCHYCYKKHKLVDVSEAYFIDL